MVGLSDSSVNLVKLVIILSIDHRSSFITLSITLLPLAMPATDALRTHAIHLTWVLLNSVLNKHRPMAAFTQR